MENGRFAFSLTQDDSIGFNPGALGHGLGEVGRHSLASFAADVFQPSSLHDLIDLHRMLPNTDVFGSGHGAPQVVLYSDDSDLLAQANQANLFHLASLRVSRHRGTTGSDGTDTSGTAAPPVTGSASAGLTINVSYDASVANAPAGFTNVVNQVVQYYESQFSDPVSINIAVGYGEVDGSPLGSGTLGESLSYLVSSNYTQVTSALAADAKTAADSSAAASLPGSNPTGGAYWMTTAEAKSLGLYSANGIDGYVGFGSGGVFDYNNSDGVTSGQYDFYGVVAHEISEVMGRMLLVGGTIGATARSYLPYDLFHYSSSGVHQFNMGGYFSANGGATSLGTFNAIAGGDAGDWSGATMDSYNAYATPGVVLPISQGDLTALDVIGWNLATAGSGSVAPPPPPPPDPPPPPPPSPSGADLSISHLSLQPTSSGGTLGFEIDNTGTGSAGASSAGIYLSTDSSITTSDVRLSSIAVSAVAAGSSSTGHANFTLPANLSPGTYYLGVYADSGNAVSESNESNNAAAVPISIGNGSANALTGTPGADTIYGLGGSDTLNGGGGSDVLIGGAGSDHFQYTSIGDGLDRIVDFTRFYDRLDFSHLAFGSNLATRGSSLGTLDSSHFIANTTGPANSAEVFWFNTANHTLYFDADGSGAGAAAAIAQFSGSIVLHNTDIHIV